MTIGTILAILGSAIVIPTTVPTGGPLVAIAARTLFKIVTGI